MCRSPEGRSFRAPQDYKTEHYAPLGDVEPSSRRRHLPLMHGLGGMTLSRPPLIFLSNDSVFIIRFFFLGGGVNYAMYNKETPKVILVVIHASTVSVQA